MIELEAPIKLYGTYDPVRITLEEYEYGGTAVILQFLEEGHWELLTVLTVMVPDDPRGGTLLWARDTEENGGLIAQLEQQGLVRATGTTRPSGFITLYEIELIGKLKELAEGMDE